MNVGAKCIRMWTLKNGVTSFSSIPYKSSDMMGLSWARNIMDSTVFRERLHGVIVPWVLWRNMKHEQGDRNNEYVPSSLFPCKWLCHKCDILLRWTPLFTHLRFQRWIHIFLLLLLLSSSLSSAQCAQTSWQLRVTRALNRSRYILSPKFGPSPYGSGVYMGVPPYPLFFVSCHMTSVLDFDWVLIFI